MSPRSKALFGIQKSKIEQWKKNIEMWYGVKREKYGIIKYRRKSSRSDNKNTH